MRIDAITSCVGQEYTEYFAKALPIWLSTLDSLTVVTTPDDYCLGLLEHYQHNPKLQYITTDIFTNYGASFNKGAALCLAYAYAKPSEWCLHIDADIVPPTDWRERIYNIVRPGFLYGVSRQSGGEVIQGPKTSSGAALWPLGYWQLWHSSDPRARVWPIYDPWHAHAGAYDADFAERWPRSQWKTLPFIVEHQGANRTNWFGKDNQQKMKNLLNSGLRKYRINAQNGNGRLKVPEPVLSYRLLSKNNRWCREVLQLCAAHGPFAIRAKYSQTSIKGYKDVDIGSNIEKEIFSLLGS